MKRLTMIAMFAMLALPLLGAPASAQGNSEAAHACQDGGYLELARSEADGGGEFGSVGECVSYAAQGGTLTEPAPEAYIQHTVILDLDGECHVDLVAVNLPPGGTYQFTPTDNSVALGGVVQGPYAYQTFGATGYFLQFGLEAPASSSFDSDFSELTVRLFDTTSAFELVETYTYDQTCPAP